MPEVLGKIIPCDLGLRATITFAKFLDDFGICTHLYLCWGTADQPPDIWAWIFLLTSDGKYEKLCGRNFSFSVFFYWAWWAGVSLASFEDP